MFAFQANQLTRQECVSEQPLLGHNLTQVHRFTTHQLITSILHKPLLTLTMYHKLRVPSTHLKPSLIPTISHQLFPNFTLSHQQLLIHLFTGIKTQIVMKFRLITEMVLANCALHSPEPSRITLYAKLISAITTKLSTVPVCVSAVKLGSIQIMREENASHLVEISRLHHQV